tara:strand:- start:535 stop:1599 length:1065 start_codon:yes stop_codon:yes gene_type:complete
MSNDSKEKIEIINKPSLRYWPKILIYLKKNYRKNHPILKKSFFYWLFFENKRFSIYITIYKKKIMSMMGYKSLKISIDNKIQNSIWLTFFSSIDTGYGLILFRKINSLNENIFTLNANKSGSVFYRKYNWKHQQIQRSVIIFDLKKSKKLITKKININKYKEFEYNNKNYTKNFDLKPLTTNLFISNKINKNKNSVIRNAKFIKWRYFDHPIFKYESFYEGNLNKKNFTYIIFRTEKYFGYQKGKVCRVVDFFCQDNLESKKNANLLLKKILSYLKKNNYEFVDFYSNDQTYVKLFNSFKVSKKINYPNFLVSRMTPILKEDFRMNFYFKTKRKIKSNISVMKSDIDGDVPEFI